VRSARGEQPAGYFVVATVFVCACVALRLAVVENDLRRLSGR